MMESKSEPSTLVGIKSTIYATLVDEAFEVTKSHYSSNIALIFEESGVVKKHTYAELDDLSNRLARSIFNITQEKNHVQNSNGDYVIAVSMRPSDSLVVILLAIWKAGMTVLPLDLLFKGRVQHILQEAKPTLVICDDDGNNAFSQNITYKDLLSICSKYPSNKLSNKECYKGQSVDNIAAILYTSGSTGVPKGVRLSHANILNRLYWQFETFPYSITEKTVIFKTALTLADSIGEIWGPLLNGLTVLVTPQGTNLNPEKLIFLLEKYEIERLVLVPSLLEAVLMHLQANNCRERLQYLKTWVCSGEVLHKSIVEIFYNQFPNNNYRLCNFYGSTEITSDVTYYTVSSLKQVEEFQNIPIGAPIFNTIVYLLDTDFSLIEEGKVGEMYISGLSLSKGYVGAQDTTKFLKNPFTDDLGYQNLYRTGDFAKMINGILIYEGRTDSQIKVRGIRVDLAEIEKALISIKSVLKGVVLSYSPSQYNQTILAFATVEKCITENDIKQILKDQLANYMVPHVIIIDFIPLLPSGKIDRRALLQKYEEGNTNSDGLTIDYTGISENQMEAAKVLFEIIASSINKLSKHSISLTSNFYEMGGNSLNTILTITLLKRKGYDIDIESFIGVKTIGELLSIMGDKCSKNALSVNSNYTTELLREEHKSDVTDIIVTAFSQKGNLVPYIADRSAAAADFGLLMKCTWSSLLQAELSFVVKAENGRIVGVALNTEVASGESIEPPYQKIHALMEILDSVEKPFLDKFLAMNNGKALQNMLAAVHLDLTMIDNVSVAKYIDEEVIKLAKRNNFVGIFSTNANPLTQQLAADVFMYTTLLDYQVNTFIAKDKSKPFASAPDSLRLLVQWKAIEKDFV